MQLLLIRTVKTIGWLAAAAMPGTSTNMRVAAAMTRANRLRIEVPSGPCLAIGKPFASQRKRAGTDSGTYRDRVDSAKSTARLGALRAGRRSHVVATRGSAFGAQTAR